MLILGVAFVGTLIGMAVLRGLLPGMVQARKDAARTRCVQQLRALSAAARQYADDGGRFPHVRALDALDGDATTADGPLAWRLLIQRGHLSDLDLLVCPARPRARRSARGTKGEERAWLRGTASEGKSLQAFSELSYGYTRRSLTSNAPGDALLAADKAVVPRLGGVPGRLGNHTEGWNVLRADGAVEWLGVEREPFPGGFLTRTSGAGAGFLGLVRQDDPSPFR